MIKTRFLLQNLLIFYQRRGTMAKDLAGKGIKDVMNDAFTAKPFPHVDQYVVVVVLQSVDLLLIK